MKTSIVHAYDLYCNNRIDATFYLSSGKIATRMIEDVISSGTDWVSLGDKAIVRIWQPNRNVLNYSVEDEPSVPYLQPYDILEYLPEERSRLSISRSEVNDLRVHAGTILQTCSGRNLGPLVIADSYLEQFVFGSDLIRIDISDRKIRHYVFAFLSTWIGQALMHSNKTGSVIDHLSALDLEKIKIPLFGDAMTSEIADLIQQSFELYSNARNELAICKREFTDRINIDIEQTRLSSGWSVSFDSLCASGRIDAAYYAPSIKTTTGLLLESGGVILNSVADVWKPSGRYKTNYVDHEYGLPILSGRQLLQEQIVGLKHLPKSSETIYKSFQLKKGWIAYPADGRVEGRLGTPVLITSAREDWYASGHIGRIKAHSNISPGYLYLAISHPTVQTQITALACGSVVDAVYPEDVEKIVIPKQIAFDYTRVEKAWDNFDKASELKKSACELLVRIILNSQTAVIA